LAVTLAAGVCETQGKGERGDEAGLYRTGGTKPPFHVPDRSTLPRTAPLGRRRHQPYDPRLCCWVASECHGTRSCCALANWAYKRFVTGDPRLPSASDHQVHRGSSPQKGGASGYELGDSHMLVATSTGASTRRERSAIAARSAWSGETRPYRCSENLWRPSRGESVKRRPQ
jgi:hypothetical protein